MLIRIPKLVVLLLELDVIQLLLRVLVLYDTLVHHAQFSHLPHQFVALFCQSFKQRARLIVSLQVLFEEPLLFLFRLDEQLLFFSSCNCTSFSLASFFFFRATLSLNELPSREVLARSSQGSLSFPLTAVA